MIVVRHPPTALNDPESERVRGWVDVPLTKDGKAQAHRVAEFFRFVGLGHNDWQVFSSPFERTEYQAKAIARTLGVGVKTDDRLKPWNLGDLQGQPVEKAYPVMRKLMKETPDEPAPGGESFNDFVERFRSFFDEHAECHDIIAVTHLRDIVLSKSLAERRGGVDPDIMDDWRTIGGIVLAKVGPEGFYPLL